MIAALLSFLSLAGLIILGGIALRGGRRDAATVGALAVVVAVLLLVARAPLASMAAAIIAGIAVARALSLSRQRRRSRRVRSAFTRQRTAGSTVRTHYIEVALNETDGTIHGQVLSGAFAGRRLGSMSVVELLDLASQIPEKEQQTLSLLTTYLDRMHPGWSESNRAGQANENPAGTVAGAMTRELAYEVLGLKPCATVEEVEKAHRRLIRRVHPDVGGSSALAAQINAARAMLSRAS